jgi:6-methylsalicylate decarboxylase
VNALTRRPVIDVHHHVIPGFYRAVLQDAGLLRPIPGVEYPRWDLATSLAMMDGLGIDAAVVSITEPGVHFAEPAAARALARQLNEYLAAMVADHPARFGAFAVLPLPDIDGALEELTYALDTLRLDGAGLLTNCRGVYAGDPVVEPVLAELNRRRTPVLLHPARPAGREQPTFGLPLSVQEFPFDTTRAIASLLFGGALDRLPQLRLIVAHAGGTVPFLAGRLASASIISPAVTSLVPADPIGTLRRLYFDTALAANRYALPSLHALADPRRVLFGTDFPFMPDSYAADSWSALGRYHAADPVQLDRVAGGNAGDLFPRLLPDPTANHFTRTTTSGS